MRILVVCAANMCRSPLLAVRLRYALADLPAVTVTSGGVAAHEGAPACPYSAARAGIDPAAHAAHRVTADEVASAGLVLAADREIRSALARLAPVARPRTFTARQAGALADHVSAVLAAGGMPEGAPPLPATPADRLGWMVAELDAARGQVAGALAGSLAGDGEDIPDPHLTAATHEVLDLVDPVAASLASLIHRVLAAPPPDPAGR